MWALTPRFASYPLGNAAAGGLVRTVNYDAASRITSFVHAGAGSPSIYDQSFGYDNLDRLTSATVGGKSLAYAYDLNGNRTQVQIAAASYGNTISATSNRLNSTTGPYPARSNLYDGAGNLTSDGTVSYTYSDRGRLSQISNAGVTVSYLYNGLGQRVSKQGSTVPTGANHFVYDEQGKVVGEYDATGAAIEETVYLGDMPVAVLKPPVAPATQLSVFYVYSDHINTPRAITRSSDNTMVWRWDLSDPFGVGQPDESPAGAGIFTYNARFPGQYYDKETNLHHNGFRDYDPQTGRYIKSDPIGLNGGIDTYAYVGGNPLSFSDPLGLCPMCLVIPGVCAAGGCELILGALGIAASQNNSSLTAPPASASKSCPADNKDPCDEIKKQIRDLQAQLAKREQQLSEDQYDLYNRAYSTNPGGDIAGKGTYTGHLAVIAGYRIGLANKIAQAKAMGCL